MLPTVVSSSRMRRRSWGVCRCPFSIRHIMTWVTSSCAVTWRWVSPGSGDALLELPEADLDDHADQ